MSKRLRFLIVIALIAVSGVFLYPTINWYFFMPDEDIELAAGSRYELREYAQSTAREALLELSELAQSDPDAPVPDEYAYIKDYARENYRLADREIPEQWTARDVLLAFRNEREAFQTIERHHRQRIERLKEMRSRIVQLGLDLSGGLSVTLEADRDSLAERLGQEPTQEQLTDAVDSAIRILSSRIDQFGVTEPSIRKQDETRILVEIPGDDDPDRVNAFLRGRGSLNFHIVDDEVTERLIEYQRENPDWSPGEGGEPEFVPAGTKVVPYVTQDEYDIDRVVRYIAIKEDVSEDGLSGQHLTEAQVGRDQLTNRPVVNFMLDRGGADAFARLTRDNVGRSMAIVMDDEVRAYATIQEEIPTGQVRISGFSQEEARDIATVLRTAALPVDLVVMNQQSIGAALGAETIRAGLYAIAVGMALVVLFMPAYYKGAGLIADLVLILNLFFIVSILSVFNLTLTLTSIAGIILTVGMAVDANVIIFERIKEEYRLGKSSQAAVTAGFDKAFWAIMDANITTFIAAIFLSQLGTGPVQGFAVTLAVGIVCSMFTALFVSRLIFDFVAEGLGRRKLSIGWGL